MLGTLHGWFGTAIVLKRAGTSPDTFNISTGSVHSCWGYRVEE